MPLLEESIIKGEVESSSGNTLALTYDDNFNKMSRLTSSNWSKSNGGEINSLVEAKYNSKDQLTSSTEHSYSNGSDGEFKNKFIIEEFSYCWENSPEILINNEANLIDLVEKTEHKISEGIPDNVKSYSCERYEYNDSDNYNMIRSFVYDPLVSGNFRKSKAIIERDPINKLPTKIKDFGLMDGENENEYVTEVFLTKTEDGNSKNTDLPIAACSSAGKRGFYFLPTADYEIHHLEDSGWYTDGRFISLKGTKFNNKVVTNSTEYTVTFSKLNELDLNKSYILCGWVNPKGGMIKLNDIVIADGESDWIYIEEVISDRERLEIICDANSMIDYIWITNLEESFVLNTYSNDLSKTNASIHPNGAISHYMYNDDGTISDYFTLDRNNEAINYEVSVKALSRFNGYNKHKDFTFDTSYDMNAINSVMEVNYLGKCNYYEELSKEITLTNNNCAIKLKNLDMNTNYGLYIKGPSDEFIAALVFDKTQEYPVRKGYYKLITEAGELLVSSEEYFTEDWIVVIQPGIFMFLGDGKPLLSSKVRDIFNKESLKISSFNTDDLYNIFVLEDPLTRMTYTNSLGEAVQTQALTLNEDNISIDNVIISENLYNGFGELCVTTKSAPTTDEDLYRYRNDFIEGFGDNNEIIGGQLYDSLINLGVRKEDVAYAYLARKVTPFTGREEESSINFGKTFTQNPLYNRRSFYDDESHITIDGVIKLGRTSFTPYKGVINSKEHNSSTSEFHTPDGSLIIGKIRNELANSLDFESMVFELKDFEEKRFIVSNQGSGDKLGYSEVKECDWILHKVGENKFKIGALYGVNAGKYIKLQDDETFSVNALFEDATTFEKGDEGTSIKFKVSETLDYWLDGSMVVSKPEYEDLIVANIANSNFKFEESIKAEVTNDWEDGTNIINLNNPGRTTNTYYNFDPSYGRIVKIKEPDIERHIYVIMDNYGRLRFKNTNQDGESTWNYYKYDNLSRMIELGVLNIEEIGDPEAEKEEIIGKANDINYPTENEGRVSMKYIYDIDVFEEDIDLNI